MQQGVQKDVTCNSLQCWELFANNVASVCTGLKAVLKNAGLHRLFPWLFQFLGSFCTHTYDKLIISHKVNKLKAMPKKSSNHYY